MKTAVWTFNETAILILIPKKRGHGFVKTPIYHSGNKLSYFLESLPYFQTLRAFGLDGHVSISPLKGSYFSDKSTVYEKVIKPMCEEFSWDSKYVSWQEFFDIKLEQIAA